MSKDIYSIAESMICNNPKFKNNQYAQEALKLIVNRDETAGVELANRILQKQGVSQEDAIQKGMDFFGFDN